MSTEDVDRDDVAQATQPERVLELSEGRLTDVGGLPVHRALPRHGRRTVGAWCFLDHFGPVDVTPKRTMTVGPHPHIGLHTVTWLLSGEVRHTDSLGNDQLIRPGQLNLMTAGNGIAHAEDSRSQQAGALHGVQLWVAQPEATRHGRPAFAHHGELPRIDLGSAEATLLLGEFGGFRSPATVDSELVGLDIVGEGSLELPLDPSFEYGIALLRGEAVMADITAATNEFVYMGTGRSDVQLDLAKGSRVLVLGGQPFEEEILMWWNFVGRGRAELEEAGEMWNARSERFGEVESTLDRIPAPRPYWTN